MKIYTSYYANIKNIPTNYTLVSISGAISDVIKKNIHIHERKLAPSLDIYNQYQESRNEKQYIKRFLEERLPKVDLFDMIEKW